MGQQLLDAESEHDGQTRSVGLKEDQDAVEVVVASEDSQDVGHVLVVLVGPTGVSYPGRVDEPDTDGSNVHGIDGRLLGGRLTRRAVVLVLVGAHFHGPLHERSSL